MKLSIIKLAVITITSLVFIDGFSQNKYSAGSKTISTELYAPTDLVFKFKSKLAESLFDVSFGAYFTSPEKKTMTIPGFYNDHKEYVIRFSLNEIGKRSYQCFNPKIKK